MSEAANQPAIHPAEGSFIGLVFKLNFRADRRTHLSKVSLPVPWERGRSSKKFVKLKIKTPDLVLRAYETFYYMSAGLLLTTPKLEEMETFIFHAFSVFPSYSI